MEKTALFYRCNVSSFNTNVNPIGPIWRAQGDDGWHLTITIKDFLQMYTIHVYLNGFYVSIIFVFMDSKTQKSYTNLYFKFHGQQLQLKMVDFEKAAHNAVLEVFDNCQVVGCHFHLSQSWFRRIKNNKELNKHYSGKTVVY
ncbi:MULE domain-containing protein [Aphis craccivora]|uniref:MULE domain-containing protein n=1 Tax=Aphis craccivora TaxID=307492 RepID=A0A6G0YLF4_APHCR|nr:MULE domain-containing protein [Aphis craccivora]